MFGFYIWLPGEKFMDQPGDLPRFKKDPGLRGERKTGVRILDFFGKLVKGERQHRLTQMIMTFKY